jgi:hypothetical protein
MVHPMHLIKALCCPDLYGRNDIFPTTCYALFFRDQDILCLVSRICGTTYTKLANINFNDLAAILRLFSGDSPNLTHPP